MDLYPSQKMLDSIRAQYPAGTRVKLIYMDDPYSKLHQGDLGTVEYVDDIGTIHIAWDRGSELGVVYGEDLIQKV